MANKSQKKPTGPAGSAEVQTKTVTAVISAPNIQEGIFTIIGESPYVQHKFAQKARATILAKQVAGSQSNSKKTREPRDIDADYKAAMHVSEEGWMGIPAPAFRNAMIDACRLVGFKMTYAKLSIFVRADGFDVDDGTPLVRIRNGEPEKHEASVRLASGVTTVVHRPMWREWELQVRVRWDADQFSVTDVSNLLQRAGQQVGIGEGRYSSPQSNGLGWGVFGVAEAATKTGASSTLKHAA